MFWFLLVWNGGIPPNHAVIYCLRGTPHGKDCGTGRVLCVLEARLHASLCANSGLAMFQNNVALANPKIMGRRARGTKTGVGVCGRGCRCFFRIAPNSEVRNRSWYTNFTVSACRWQTMRRLVVNNETSDGPQTRRVTIQPEEPKVSSHQRSIGQSNAKN